ncbi:MAG: oxidative damage protection protein [Pseudomonadales bacterium]|nr:oxidative damage protection protein [Pseudomonadales bacterium]
MSRTVFCKKYKQDKPGLEQPPYPGPKGEEIFNHVSAQAWQEWQNYQTMLINEKQLTMAKSADRKFLAAEMDKYFANEAVEVVQGYVPPSA